MKNPIASIIGATALTPCLFVSLPMAKANAHGYVSTPPSRQAQCQQGIVTTCGTVKYEPQSVEGRQGQRNCHAGIKRWDALNDDSRPWKSTSVGTVTSFTWTKTAVHRTANWEYYIGSTRIAKVDYNNKVPPSTVTHQLDLSGFSGRQKLLAIWNIGDTQNAFYSCVDLQIDGGDPPPPTSTTTPPPPTTTTPPPPTTTTPPPPTTTTPPPPTTTRTPPAGGVKRWAVGATYAIGDRVRYQGRTYQCLQAHTVHASNWTPPNTPALWKMMY
ncbi:lytic polysaccharide monooxygenase [Mycobacterium sp.]|uniref:lytic polysaccharide monooxygenase n=1 Tax=Mycobacterium sp. TaxID=1785 RepID=UPI003BABED43